VSLGFVAFMDVGQSGCKSRFRWHCFERVGWGTV